MSNPTIRELIDAAIAASLKNQDADLREYAEELSDFTRAAGFGDISEAKLAYIYVDGEQVRLCVEEETGFGHVQSRTHHFPTALIDAPDPLRAAKKWALEQKVQRAKGEITKARRLLESREQELVKAEEENAAFLGQA